MNSTEPRAMDEQGGIVKRNCYSQLKLGIESPLRIFHATGVAKPALGRGLGTLLGADRIAGKTGEIPSPTSPTAAPAIGRGVGNLLQGVSEEADGEFVTATAVQPFEIAADKPLPTERLLPNWYFFIADALLLVLAGLIVLRRKGPLNGPEISLISVLVSGGAALTVWPFLARNEQESTPSAASSTKWILGSKPGAGGECYVIHLHEPQFIGRVAFDGGRLGIVPVSALAWSRIPRAAGDQLLREALSYYRTQAKSQQPGPVGD